MNIKVYRSELGNISIEYKIDGNNAHIIHTQYEPRYIKLFLIKLRESINDLRKLGIKTVSQTVSEEEWVNYLEKDKKWKIKTNSNYYEIEANIDDIYYCILRGFGIYEDKTEYKTIY